MKKIVKKVVKKIAVVSVLLVCLFALLCSCEPARFAHVKGYSWEEYRTVEDRLAKHALEKPGVEVKEYTADGDPAEVVVYHWCKNSVCEFCDFSHGHHACSRGVDAMLPPDLTYAKYPGIF